MSHSDFPPIGTRRFGSVNWLGVWTLYLKEVRRFLKVITQTVAAPVVTTLLFLAIFSLALGRFRPDINGIHFIDFLAPGLIMMSVIQNAFANTSSSILISKVQGNVVDILMPPLAPGELNTAFALGGVTRGVMVALVAGLGMLPFVDLGIAHLWAVVYFVIAGALMLSLIGILAGVWADKFDHMQAIANFIITPLSFLSGTFYSVKQLPDFAYSFSQYNPFFYMIDGFRYGFTGVSDADVTTGALFILALDILLWIACHRMFSAGYRLKA